MDASSRSLSPGIRAAALRTVTDISDKRRVFAGGSWAPDDLAEADRQKDQDGQPERDGVGAENELRPSDEHDGCRQSRPGDVADVCQRAVEGRRGGKALAFNQARKRRETGRLEERRPNAGKKGEAQASGQIRPTSDEPGKRAAADDIGKRSCIPCGTTGPRAAPNTGPSTMPGMTSAKQDQPDRPRRVETVEGEDQEGDKSGAGAERRLPERDEDKVERAALA